jgi:hypothetical protein
MLKAKTWFLAQKVKIALGLALLVMLVGLVVRSYQVGKLRAEHSCELQKAQRELQVAQDSNKFLLDLQEESVEFYRNQAAFNSVLSNKLEERTVETIREIKTIYRETPVEVTNPCGNASIGYGFVRMRNDAGNARPSPN